MTSRLEGGGTPDPKPSGEENGGGLPPKITVVGSEEPGELPDGLHPLFVKTADRIFASRLPRLSLSIVSLLGNAQQEASTAGDEILGLRHIFLGLLEQSFVQELLNRQDINIAEARSTLIDNSTKEPKSPRGETIIDACVLEALWLAADYADKDGTPVTDSFDVFNACRELRSHDPNLDQLLRKMGIPQAKR